MPPDDYAASILSPNPQRPGRNGIQYIEGTGYLDLLRQWDTENRAAEQTERLPDSRQESQRKAGGYGSLDTSVDSLEEPNAFRIKFEQAVELGLINSREYQTERENLYLSALPVTLERFAFSTQFFALGEAIRERTGRLTSEGQNNRWRLNTSTGFRKLFSTGALLLLQFANQTVINLSGPGRHTISESSIDLDIIQPLLRGGGRAVTLEPLTQAERDLLYAIRNFARFRQEFFVAIAGTTSRNSPLAVNFAPRTGFLPTVLQRARLENQAANVRRLESYMGQFLAFKEGGIMNQVQVGQVEQQLLRSRDSLYSSMADYRITLDRFKLQLGIPPPVPLELDMGIMQPVFEHSQRYNELLNMHSSLVQQLQQLAKLNDVLKLRSRLLELMTESDLVRDTSFRMQGPAEWNSWRKLGRIADVVDRLNRLRQQRQPLLDKLDQLAEKGQELPAKDKELLDRIDLQIAIGTLELQLRQFESAPWRKVKGPASDEMRAALFNAVENAFLALMETPYRERQEQVRRSWPALPPCCVNGIDLLKVDREEALAAAARTALENRVDLMNARAQLVDAWRKIRVSANALMGVFNVQYHMDSTTPLGLAQPLAFSGSRSRHQLILNGELPLVRLPERNEYRLALINYQRQRRALMRFEDEIVFSVRAELNQLRALERQYNQVQRRAIELAYQQVDQAFQALRQPPEPSAQPEGRVGPPPTGGSGDPAALTRQLLDAQSSLLGAQNDLYDIWVEYLTTRLTLYRDLGLMPLDTRGVWLDDVATCDPTCNRQESEQHEEPGDGERLPVPRRLPQHERDMEQKP